MFLSYLLLLCVTGNLPQLQELDQNIMSDKSFQEIWASVIGPILGIIGIVISIIAIFATDRDFKDLKSSSEELISAISTKYIGLFPDNMDMIVDLVENAEKNLTIVVDVPGYGVLSKNELYQRYETAIRNHINNGEVKVKIFCYSDSTRIKAMEDQFDENIVSQESEKIKSLVNFIESKMMWNSEAINEKKQNIETKQDLINLTNLVQKEIITELESVQYTSNEFFTLENRQEMFIWIRDDKEAVFSILNYGQNNQEASFLTQDANFIEILRDRIEGLEKEEGVNPFNK